MSECGSSTGLNRLDSTEMDNYWQFGGMEAPELIRLLLKALPEMLSEASTARLPTNGSELYWHICWLNNDGAPVIGLLPKASWSAYPLSPKATNTTPLLHIVATERNASGYSACVEKTLSTESWQQELIAYTQTNDAQHSSITNCDTDSTSSQYINGLMGFIGYDIAAQQLSPKSDIANADQPYAYLGHYDITLQARAEGWQLITQEDTDATIIDSIKQCLDSIDNQLSLPAPESLPYLASPPALHLQPDWDYPDYQYAFARTQQYLNQGDCYQINLTQAWRGYLTNNHACHPHSLNRPGLQLIDYLPALHANTQAPFAGYLHLADFELLSCSPELFFVFESSLEGKQQIRTKPIKGTRPRGHNVEEDNALKTELANSDKDRAENVMIVDLLRNDLGKYAQTGSVKVPKLFAIESFSNVHHMVSTITATIREEVHPLTMLFDSLPAGSITGTPKKRAVEIIAELESAARGAYCGTMGYMNFDGSGQWNVLIRTLQANSSGQVSLWAGGGITVSSDCAAEYQECLDKVGNLLGVLAAAQPK